MRVTPKPEPKLLVYDVETYATGFADPQWVPQVATCIAWKWYGSENAGVAVRTSIDARDPRVPMPHLDPDNIRLMLTDFIPAYLEAEGVITYNGAQFDQPVINAMLWYVGWKPLPGTMVYDLHRFGRVKGMKKGLDNVAAHLGVAHEKQAMNHAQWQTAYLEPGWPTIKSRAESDVILTEEVFDAVNAVGWLRPARGWRP